MLHLFSRFICLFNSFAFSLFCVFVSYFFFFKQKTAYEMRISDWSSDVCSSDLTPEDWEPVELPLFRSTQFGDDQDRPIKKSDGSWTYFGADLAYHFQKSQNADELIDIWGADHAGTVKRIKAAVAALTDGKTDRKSTRLHSSH